MKIDEFYKELTISLIEHTNRVIRIAIKIGKAHALDLEKIAFAAKYHDLARITPDEILLSECKKLDIPVSNFDKQLPMLLHGPVAASWVRTSNNVMAVPEVIEAVQNHSIATPNMGQIAKVVFLADKLDPNKAQRYPFQSKVHAASEHDLDKALLIFTHHEIAMRLKLNQHIHPQSIATRHYLLQQFGDSYS